MLQLLLQKDRNYYFWWVELCNDHWPSVVIILGIGVGVVFILLGFTVYFFLSCINERLPEPELAAENIYINAKSGNINSKTSSSPRPVTAVTTVTSPPGVDNNYYPVGGRRRRTAGGDSAGGRYDRHGRALAPSCISPLLALVATAAICFIAILMVLCYLSNVVDS